jgi:hypothetical protein
VEGKLQCRSRLWVRALSVLQVEMVEVEGGLQYRSRLWVRVVLVLKVDIVEVKAMACLVHSGVPMTLDVPLLDTWKK